MKQYKYNLNTVSYATIDKKDYTFHIGGTYTLPEGDDLVKAWVAQNILSEITIKNKK